MRDLSTPQRRAVFVLVVVVLAGLGMFLLIDREHASPSAAPATPPATTPPVSTGTGTSASAPAAGGSGTHPGGVNIYQWLPFSQSGLASAAATTRAFCADYVTYTRGETATAYMSRMRGLVTPALAGTLGRGFATLGAAPARGSQRQSSTGHCQITALQTFGSGSLTFSVTVTQRITGTGTAARSTGYAVTVTGSGRNWRASDIELATAGNS